MCINITYRYLYLPNAMSPSLAVWPGGLLTNADADDGQIVEEPIYDLHP